MPLYFFNVYNDEITMDEEGQDLPDLEAVHKEAVKSAREMMCDNVRAGEVTLSHRIEVVDESREIVLNVTYGEAVQVNP